MAYKILFFATKESWCIVKEIGERLKETRENIGISIEEAAEDLKTRPSQIENMEAGNMDAFKDIFYLKYFIRDYAKYLGLDYEDMVDEFNEYLFDYTSKISLDDIKNAHKKETKTEKEERVMSPYTLERKDRIPRWLIYVLISIILVLVAFFSIRWIIDNNKNNDKQTNKPNIIN